MANLADVEYTPIPENVAVYDKLYQEFLRLHDTFGRGDNDVMKRLKKIQLDVINKK
jgi:L-ribulokinase